MLWSLISQIQTGIYILEPLASQTLEKETLEILLPVSTVWGHSGKIASCKPEGETSPEPDHAGLDLGSPVTRTVGNTFLFFKLPGLWYVVMAARADKMQASYMASLFTSTWELLHCWGEKRAGRERMRCWRQPCGLEDVGGELRPGVSGKPREQGKDLGS